MSESGRQLAEPEWLRAAVDYNFTVAVSLMQKIRLALRGWMRRRAQSAEGRKAEFMERNAGWTAPAASAPARDSSHAAAGIDLEGLQVAFLDDSGKIEHYLDASSGEVVDILSADLEACRQARQNASYRRIPARSAESDALDRAAFVEAMDDGEVRRELQRSLGMADEAKEFRKALARDRAAERAWYNFKNDRAIAAIEDWLRKPSA